MSSALCRAGLVFALLAVLGRAQALEIESVSVEERARPLASGPELRLNGAGLRTRMFLNVYVAALYLPERRTTAAEVLTQTGPKRVSLSFLRDLSSTQMVGAFGDGLKANLAPAEQERLRPQIDQLNRILNGLKKVRDLEVMTLDWIPGTGTRISLQGQPRGTPIEGPEFYSALLRIWLGENPVDEPLKQALLGRH